MVYTHEKMVKLVDHGLTKQTVVNGWMKYEIFWSSPLIWECLKISSGLIWPTLRRHINSRVNLSWISNRIYVFYLLHSCIITFPKLDIYFQSWWMFIYLFLSDFVFVNISFLFSRLSKLIFFIFFVLLKRLWLWGRISFVNRRIFERSALLDITK